MKRSLLLFALQLIYNLAFPQAFYENFLGKDFERYKGITIKYHPYEYGEMSLIYTVYKDENELYKLFGENVAYPDETHSFKTVTDSLKNKTFKVIDVFTDKNSKYRIQYNHAVLKISDEVSGEILFLRYDSEHSLSFPFYTSPIEMNNEEICSFVKLMTDDPFTKEKTYVSDFMMPIVILKVNKSGSANYFLSMKTKSDYLDISSNGVKILFTDGSIMNLNSTIETNVTADAEYEYSTYARLSLSNLKILQSKNIKIFRLNVFDEVINNYDSEKFRIFSNCISNVN